MLKKHQKTKKTVKKPLKSQKLYKQWIDYMKFEYWHPDVFRIFHIFAHLKQTRLQKGSKGCGKAVRVNKQPGIQDYNSGLEQSKSLTQQPERKK